MKFGELFKSIRTAQQLTLDDVSERCGLHRTTIWKMERGFLPRGESLRLAMSLGLRLKENSLEYRQLRALWTEIRTGVPVDPGEQSKETATVRRASVADAARLVSEIAALPDYLQTEIRRVIQNPRALRLLKGLNDLSDA